MANFNTNDYLHWYINRMRLNPSSINLHSSGVEALSLDNFIIDIPAHARWEITGRFEEQLASWLGIPATEILFTPGGTGGTLLALLTLVSPGDRVLVESPIYEPLLRQATRLGRISRFKRQMSNRWELPLKEIEAELKDGVKLVMITEPSNPSGTFARREDVLSVIRLAEQHGAILLINEVYREFSSAPSYHRASENVLIVSSFSKLIGTYGFRLGWLSGPPEMILKLRTGHMNMSMSNQAAAAIGLGILEKIDSLRADAVNAAQRGLDNVDQFVEATDGLHWVKPRESGYGAVALPDKYKNDIDFAEKFLEKENVFTIPGTYFEAPGTLRISWLQAGDQLEEGLVRLAKFLRDS